MAKIAKAIEISEAKISFVSLVGKAANQRQFLITKADGGQASFTSTGKILKSDADTHYVTGIVYEPLVEDTDGKRKRGFAEPRTGADVFEADVRQYAAQRVSAPRDEARAQG